MHGLGGRSLTESSIDNDTTEATAVPARWRRRSVIAGIAGTAVGATALTATRFLPDGDGLPEATDVRRSAEAPADAGGFANRDESYASIGQPAQISATQVAPPTLVYATAAEAAAAAEVVVPTILDPADPVIHLLRRTSFGPTPGLVDEVHAVGIDAWLAAQLDPIAIADPLADAVWAAHPLANADPATVQATTERYSWDAMFAFGKATLARQVWSNRQLYEVMVDFWANHLNVPTPGPGGWDVAPSYHRGVIRTHALGTFTDMLVAAGRHPALLRYLTAEQSTKDSVNENLGRELLELHTVGVASGYTEADVRNSAFILTGRTVVAPGGTGQEAAFRFDPGMHWVGPVTVLDFQHPNATAEGGLEVGDAYLRHLAGHPATAQTIARKLAVRFVSDMPPPELVDRLAAAYLDNGTAIVPVLDTLFRSVEFWSAVGQKTRRPLENVAASVRILEIVPQEDTVRSVDALYQAATRSGHRPLSWPAPNGYPDVHAAWRSAGNVVEVWNAHRMLIGDWDDGLSRPDPMGLVEGGPAATVGEYVDSLCQRLCFQAFQPAHRDALVAFLGGDPAAPIGRFVDNNEVLSVIALVLDSPYFSLR
jgi:uncharacterized protein (DUF1800 family)